MKNHPLIADTESKQQNIVSLASGEKYHDNPTVLVG